MKNNIREIRKKIGLRQVDVADALGLISSDRISHWETGISYPSIFNLFKMARLFNVRAEELYQQEE